jgi:hypothetical protein
METFIAILTDQHIRYSLYAIVGLGCAFFVLLRSTGRI